ncbi:UDP-glucose 4-epimerase [Tamaricihabitans halophyticus]|uniref:UDP-glucose 4-epimerase n=1 Tax=Tamaricihabitans halophyticus TaxID=1262583 RepID=A0A4R2Q4B8_9PSEU|nr:NAD(P)-dependent oxidoreductase [Tamaricihabitans halophyticus]TCP43437.1 UDP-glucose 4-epimerase [Tamaricihabitans halophyticus]
MNQVVVTGASGFLGRAVHSALTAAGHAVLGTDVRPSGELRGLDVSDPAELDQVLAGGPDAIVHLAAAGAGSAGLVAGADTDPVSAVQTNIAGFVRVVEAAARNGVRRVVWSSSTTVYGSAAEYSSEIKESGVIEESAPLRPTTAYGVTKAACEQFGPILASRLGVEVVSLRLPMVYGPGRWYGGSQAQLVDLVHAVTAGTPASIDAWRGAADWVHVDDAAAAVLALLAAPEPAASYHVVGHRGSLAELAMAIAASAKHGTVDVRETDAGTPDLPATDDHLLRSTTGWTPQYTDASSGATSYLRRARSQPDLPREEVPQ